MAASYSHLKSHDGQMSQETQPMESRKRKEPQGECSITVEENPVRDVSIYRVPNILMSNRAKREAYVPTRVWLGPYRHKTEKVRSMDSQKKRVQERMTIRFNDPNNRDFLAAAREEIMKVRKEISANYEENINWNKDLFKELTLDGFFILEILSALSDYTLPEAGNCNEPLFEKKKILYTGRDILNDMLKLENQMPFIVLLKLLKLQCSSTDSDAENTLSEMLRKSFLRLFYPFESKLPPKERRWSWPQPQPHHHLLDWLRVCIIYRHSDNGHDMLHGDIAHSHNGEHDQNGYTKIPSQDEESAKDSDQDEDLGAYDHIHPAIELENAGIKLEQCEGGIANIHFDVSRNTIYLPRITVKDSTEILFRNLIAFDMCTLSEKNEVACYVRLLDQLIDSEEDVALLRKRHIITNHLGSDAEVAKLFNGLCRGAIINLEGAFDHLTKKVHDHYYNKFRVQEAELVREYFSSPWKTLGLLGGIALLLLTIVQTIVAILALYK